MTVARARGHVPSTQPVTRAAGCVEHDRRLILITSGAVTMTALPRVAQAAHSPATCLVAALRRFQTLICAIWKIKAARAGSS